QPTSAGTISLGHPGVNDVAAETSGDAARYRGAFQGRDIVSQLTATGLKEAVITQSVAAGGAYTDTFALPSGVTARTGTNGVEFVTKAGTVVAGMGNGAAWDSSSPIAAAIANTPVSTSLVSQTGAIAAIAIAVSHAWFNDLSRTFQVTHFTQAYI